MLFLILLCTVFSAVSAEEDYAGKQYYHNLMKQHDFVAKYFLNLNNCSTGHMNYESYSVLGITERTYDLNEFKLRESNTTYFIERLFMKYREGRTVGQIISLAKDERPELTKEINHFAAVTLWEPYVYLASTRLEIIEKRKCIVNNVCKMNLLREEAIYLLDEFLLKVEDLIVKFGSQTQKTLETATELFERSKILGLYCNDQCVQEQYNKWVDHCLGKSTIIN